MEQEDYHVVMAGFQKGAQGVGHNLSFIINEIAVGFFYCSLGKLNDTLSLYLFVTWKP